MTDNIPLPSSAEYLDIYRLMYNAHWSAYWAKIENHQSKTTITSQVKDRIFWACTYNFGEGLSAAAVKFDPENEA